ncbi:unnamed protein product [Prorocentrum cordatum]|uniref:Uncharacterized protein n=1 Tax=Prorocentrum cordatum TaxID=2364126 RepID=A0ABN9VUF9_9DINO|nr:unnamed protein product [Polarella glacialis]
MAGRSAAAAEAPRGTRSRSAERRGPDRGEAAEERRLASDGYSYTVGDFQSFDPAPGHVPGAGGALAGARRRRGSGGGLGRAGPALGQLGPARPRGGRVVLLQGRVPRGARRAVEDRSPPRTAAAGLPQAAVAPGHGDGGRWTAATDHRGPDTVDGGHGGHERGKRPPQVLGQPPHGDTFEARLNVICRHYLQNDSIPMHFDKKDWFEEDVYGCVLMNSSDRVLEFQAAEGSQPKDGCYMLPEAPGACFCQRGAARFDAAELSEAAPDGGGAGIGA